MKDSDICVEKLVVGSLQTNCYLVYGGKNKEGVIIDPGDDADYISSVIQRKSIKPKLIIATHGHFDHVLAVEELKLIYKIPFALSYKDCFLVKSANTRAKYFNQKDINMMGNFSIDRDLDKRKFLTVGNIKFILIETPGHTPGSISLYLKKEKIIFVGDLIFANGELGRTDLSYGNVNQLNKSIKKIKALSDSLTIFSGHGEIWHFNE